MFDVTVKVFNDNLDTVESARGNYVINLSLDPGGILNCPSQTGSLGVYVFAGCQISTNGNFYLVAQGSDLVSGRSGPYLVQDPAVSSITISTDVSTQSTYFDIEVTVSIFDQAGVAYSSGSISVTLSSSLSLYGQTTSICDYTSYTTFKIYFKESGNPSITATVQTLSESTSVTILLSTFKNLLISPSIQPWPFYPIDEFSASIEGYNSAGSTKSTFHSFSVSINLTPSLTSWSSTSSSSSGSVVFSALTINTANTYVIEFSALGFESFSSDSIQIHDLTLDRVVITSSVSTIGAFEKFSLTVKLYDQRNRLWTMMSLVELQTSLSVGGTVSGSTETGEISFEVYGKVPGSLQVVAKCSGISGDVGVDVLKVLLKIGLNKPVVMDI